MTESKPAIDNESSDLACPHCAAPMVRGTLTRSAFRPAQLKAFSFSLSVPTANLESESAACAACGLVLARVDANKLRYTMRENGDAALRQIVDDIAPSEKS